MGLHRCLANDYIESVSGSAFRYLHDFREIILAAGKDVSITSCGAYMATGNLAAGRTLGCFGGFGVGLLVSFYLLSGAEKAANSPDEALWVAYLSAFFIWPGFALVGGIVGSLLMKRSQKKSPPPVSADDELK